MREREHARHVAATINTTEMGLASGGVSSENEQLVWVLWKILKGDGDDVRDMIRFR